MENLVLNAEPPHAPECKVELSKIEEKVDSADDSFPKESENPKLDLQASITEPTTKYFQALSRKEKRNYIKKLRRKQIRQEAAEKERLEELARLQDAEEQLETLLQEKIEAELLEKERAEHEEQEKLFYERERAAQEEFEKRQAESLKKEEEKKANQDDENWRYVEDDGPPEIIWRGNEIIVRKKKIRVPVEHVEQLQAKNEDHATSNPLPPQSTAFAAHKHPPPSIPDVGEQNPTFGTEQDKTHCPFHIKTGVCRFGVRCSRVHVYPEQSFTLLMRNMYTGPGLSWDHDEGLELFEPFRYDKDQSFSITSYFREGGKHSWSLDEGKGTSAYHSDEEVAQQYEEFYDDVHSEFLQYGELVNFKVCKNGSSHLRGNLYVHYQTEAGAQAAYNATNGRFYAGKQITCEFVGVTRWRVALCGEYMKGHHRPCSHGTACNFLHCFRNPRGEYDWADWDSPPPRYWSAKMAKLFGYKDDLREEDDYYHHDPHRRHRAAESSWTREGSPDRASRSKSRYSRHDEYDYSSRRREHRRHRSRDQHAQSSCDELENSSRHATRRRNQRQSPGTISERSRRRSPGDMYEKRKYKPERKQGLLTSQDMTPSMNSDDSELSDQDQRYKRDHDVEDSSADELQHPSTRTRKRYTRDFEYHNRGSSREPQHSPSRAHKSRREKYKDGSIEKEVTASPRDPEDETKAGKISRKGQVVERNESSSRQGSRKRSSRRKDLEDGSGDSEVDRFHRHPRSESKTSKRERKKRRRSDRHRDQMVESRFLEQEDRWNLDVDAQN